MDSARKKSKVWMFIIAAVILLLLLAVNSLLLSSENGVKSAKTLPFNTFLSFLLAAIAVATAVTANVSAFMNTSSPSITKVISPIILVISFITIVPLFIAMGLTLAG